MKPIHVALIALTLGSSSLVVAHANDMEGMNMGKQDSDKCTDMQGMNQKQMKNMDMKGMDMQKCQDKMKTHSTANAGEPAHAAQIHHATGVIKAIDAGTGQVTLSHGPVETLHWPAMTMTFKVKDKALLNHVSVGQKATADFVKQGSDYVVMSIE